jgi:hypothetical protein
MSRRAVLSLATVLIMTVSGYGALPYPSSTSEDGGAAALVTAERSTPAFGIVATGRALQTDGTPVPAGTAVTLKAWPSNERLARLPEGAKVPVVAVGRAKTDADGRWAVRYDALDAVKKSASPNGLVNLEVVSESRGLTSTFSFVGMAPTLRTNIAADTPHVTLTPTHTTPVSIPSATKCLIHDAGTTFTGKWGKAHSFAGGVQTAGILGIDLNVSTGFSSDAASYYKFSKTRKLCGSNDYEGGQPRRLVVKIP